MNHRIFAFTAVLLVACVAVGATGATAQGIELNETIDTGDDVSYVEEIDSDTRIVSWDYDDSREGFEIVFETDRSKQITITEAVQFSEGAGSGRIYQQRLPEGTSEVFVAVPRRGGQAAVTMTTRESINDGRFSYVSTGETSPDRPPISYERAQIIIVLTALGSAGLVFGVVRSRREEEDRGYERIL